jgi:hypothetical protein
LYLIWYQVMALPALLFVFLALLQVSVPLVSGQQTAEQV